MKEESIKRYLFRQTLLVIIIGILSFFTYATFVEKETVTCNLYLGYEGEVRKTENIPFDSYQEAESFITILRAEPMILGQGIEVHFICPVAKMEVPVGIGDFLEK